MVKDAEHVGPVPGGWIEHSDWVEHEFKAQAHRVEEATHPHAPDGAGHGFNPYRLQPGQVGAGRWTTGPHKEQPYHPHPPTKAALKEHMLTHHGKSLSSHTLLPKMRTEHDDVHAAEQPHAPLSHTHVVDERHDLRRGSEQVAPGVHAAEPPPTGKGIAHSMEQAAQFIDAMAEKRATQGVAGHQRDGEVEGLRQAAYFIGSGFGLDQLTAERDTHWEVGNEALKVGDADTEARERGIGNGYHQALIYLSEVGYKPPEKVEKPPKPEPEPEAPKLRVIPSKRASASETLTAMSASLGPADEALLNETETERLFRGHRATALRYAAGLLDPANGAIGDEDPYAVILRRRDLHKRLGEGLGTVTGDNVGKIATEAGIVQGYTDAINLLEAGHFLSDSPEPENVTAALVGGLRALAEGVGASGGDNPEAYAGAFRDVAALIERGGTAKDVLAAMEGTRLSLTSDPDKRAANWRGWTQAVEYLRQQGFIATPTPEQAMEQLRHPEHLLPVPEGQPIRSEAGTAGAPEAVSVANRAAEIDGMAMEGNPDDRANWAMYNTTLHEVAAYLREGATWEDATRPTLWPRSLGASSTPEQVRQRDLALANIAKHFGDRMSPRQFISKTHTASDTKDMVVSDITARLLADPDLRAIHDMFLESEGRGANLDEQWNPEAALADRGQPSGIMDDEAAKAGVITWQQVYGTVNQAIQRWAQSAFDTHNESIAMQLAAVEEFGLDEQVRNRTLQSLEAKKSDLSYGGAAGETLAVSVLKTYRQRGAFYRRFLRHMYENTQDQLREAGIEQLSLYRGVGGSLGEQEGEVNVVPHAMSSWSTEQDTAESFAEEGGTVLQSTFPRESIIGSAQSGFGCLNEYEFIVLGHGADRSIADPQYWEGDESEWEASHAAGIEWNAVNWTAAPAYQFEQSFDMSPEEFLGDTSSHGPLENEDPIAFQMALERAQELVAEEQAAAEPDWETATAADFEEFWGMTPQDLLTNTSKKLVEAFDVSYETAEGGLARAKELVEEQQAKEEAAATTDWAKATAADFAKVGINTEWVASLTAGHSAAYLANFFGMSAEVAKQARKRILQLAKEAE